jgi:hypothetical protein
MCRSLLQHNEHAATMQVHPTPRHPKRTVDPERRTAVYGTHVPHAVPQHATIHHISTNKKIIMPFWATTCTPDPRTSKPMPPVVRLHLARSHHHYRRDHLQQLHISPIHQPSTFPLGLQVLEPTSHHVSAKRWIRWPRTVPFRCSVFRLIYTSSSMVDARLDISNSSLSDPHADGCCSTCSNVNMLGS